MSPHARTLAAALVATVVGIASAAAPPAITATGENVVVNAADLELEPASGGARISLAAISQAVDELVDSAKEHEPEVGAILERLKVAEGKLSVSETANAALATRLEAAEGKLGGALDRATALEGRITKLEAGQTQAAADVDGLAEGVSANSAALQQFNGSDGLSGAVQSILVQLGGLEEDVAKLIHPEMQVVYGPWVGQDDAPSPAVCPAGLSPSRCTAEHLKGCWNLDGIKVTATGCTAYAGGPCGVPRSSGVIRAKLECSDVHDTTKVVKTELYVRKPDGSTGTFKGAVLTLDCPSGFKAFSCHCHSPWKDCQEQGWGFFPVKDAKGVLARCEHKTNTPIDLQRGRNLGAICVKNE